MYLFKKNKKGNVPWLAVCSRSVSLVSFKHYDKTIFLEHLKLLI